MSEPAPDEPSPALRAVAHAVAVMVVWCVAMLLGQVAASSVAWPELGLARLSASAVVDALRWCAVLGIGAAVAAHRRPRSTRRRAALESVAIAYVVQEAGYALWIGAAAAGELFGAPLTPFVASMGIKAQDMLSNHLSELAQPGLHLTALGLALGLFLGSARRGRRSEGLALAGPTELASMAVMTAALRDALSTPELVRFFAVWSLARLALVAALLPFAVRGADALARRWARRDD